MAQMAENKQQNQGEITENMLYTAANDQESEFPHAPQGWSKEEAVKTGGSLGLDVTDDHWEVVRSLQDYFTAHEFPNRRELNDALEERFHAKGGRRYLYMLFPGGPVSQGCQLAGLEMPAGSIDLSFGSSV